MSMSKSLQVDQIQYEILSFENKTGVKYCSKTYSKNIMSCTSLRKICIKSSSLIILK